MYSDQSFQRRSDQNTETQVNRTSINISGTVIMLKISDSGSAPHKPLDWIHAQNEKKKIKALKGAAEETSHDTFHPQISFERPVFSI